MNFYIRPLELEAGFDESYAFFSGLLKAIGSYLLDLLEAVPQRRMMPS